MRKEKGGKKWGQFFKSEMDQRGKQASSNKWKAVRFSSEKGRKYKLTGSDFAERRKKYKACEWQEKYGSDLF